MPLPQHDPPTYKCLIHNIVIGRVRDYFKATHTLAPFSLAPTSSDTTLVFIALHLELDGYFLLFLKDYKLDQELKLFFHYFKLAFQCMSHLSINGLSRMVFEHLWDCFHLEDLASGFL